MDFYTLVSTGLDEKLKCFVCENYLSYFPISLCSNSKSICGRCTVPEGLICHHEEALEVLCQLLRFPCRYQTQGCCEELSPEDIPQHEESCIFRVVTCVKNKSSFCNWSGTLPTLLSHCQSEHADLFLKNGQFEIALSHLDECIFLMECNKNVITVTQKVEIEGKILHFTLYSPYQSFNENINWQLRIQGRNISLLLDLGLNSFEKKIYRKVLLHSVVEECIDQPLLCKISSQKKTDVIAQPQAYETCISEKCYDIVKCSDCADTLKPPVYRVVDEGMRVRCDTCRKKLPTKCKSYFLINQWPDDLVNNFLIKLVKYPCQYQSNGCRFISHFEQLKIHHKDCKYRKEKCPLYQTEKCAWEGFLSDANTHIACEHHNLNLNLKSEYKISATDLPTTCKILKLSNCLFRLVYKMNNDCYMWSIQMIYGEGETFKYQIDVVDATNNGQRLSVRKFCALYTTEEDVFKDPSNYFYVPKDQVSALTKSEEEGPVLIFKLRIFK